MSSLVANTAPEVAGVAIDIGGVSVLLRTGDPSFRRMLRDRYAGFLTDVSEARFSFDVDLAAASQEIGPDEEVDVRLQHGQWVLCRGDFRAEWDPVAATGRVRQSPNPYAIDSVLRIVHTLVLARQGGFLVHGASAIRKGRAFVFAGVSGAGKTTISRLAPPDATLLSDEISYVRRSGSQYVACGTPFAGELAKSGENQSAPLTALLFLAKGDENRLDDLPPQEAVRRLLRNVLFFADDSELVSFVFQSVCEFVTCVPVQQLTFMPDERVWEMIR